MKTKQHVEELEIPDGVEVRYENQCFIVKSGKTEIQKKLVHPQIKITIDGKKIIFTTDKFTKKEKRMINTFYAHLKNMFKGSKEKYVYKMKICSGHFPMNVAVAKDEFIVKNFIGEKTPRVLKLVKGVEVKVEGEVVIIESHDREIGGQTAGDIEQLTRRPGFDKRIYQEGIYITEKPGKKMM